MIASGVPRGLPSPNFVVASVHPPERPIPDDPIPTFDSDQRPITCFSSVDMPLGTLANRFRHSGWQRLRAIVYKALWATEQGLARYTAFSDCGHGAYVMQSIDNPHRYRLAGST